MDKKSVIGFVVIGVILIGWMIYTSKMQKPVQPPKQNTENVTDSNSAKLNNNKVVSDKKDSVVKTESSEDFGNLFHKNTFPYVTDSLKGYERFIIVENEKYKFEFTSYGGAMKKAYMKDFKTWDGKELQLVDWQKERELNLMFTSKEGKLINTKDLAFTQVNTETGPVDITKQKSFTLKYVLNVGGDSTTKITKIYTFVPDSYEFKVDFEFTNPVKYIADSKYQVVWGSSLNLTERRSDEEAQFSEAFSYMGGELEQMQPSDFNKEVKFDANGNLDFVSTRNKYFGVFIIPSSRKGDGAYLTGNKIHLPDEGSKGLFYSRQNGYKERCG